MISPRSRVEGARPPVAAVRQRAGPCHSALIGVPANVYGEGQYYRATSGAAYLIGAQTVILNTGSAPSKNHLILSETH
jgi:hypothetical protein